MCGRGTYLHNWLYICQKRRRSAAPFLRYPRKTTGIRFPPPPPSPELVKVKSGILVVPSMANIQCSARAGYGGALCVQSAPTADRLCQQAARHAIGLSMHCITRSAGARVSRPAQDRRAVSRSARLSAHWRPVTATRAHLGPALRAATGSESQWRVSAIRVQLVCHIRVITAAPARKPVSSGAAGRPIGAVRGRLSGTVRGRLVRSDGDWYSQRETDAVREKLWYDQTQRDVVVTTYLLSEGWKNATIGGGQTDSKVGVTKT